MLGNESQFVACSIAMCCVSGGSGVRDQNHTLPAEELVAPEWPDVAMLDISAISCFNLSHFIHRCDNWSAGALAAREHHADGGPECNQSKKANGRINSASPCGGHADTYQYPARISSIFEAVTIDIGNRPASVIMPPTPCLPGNFETQTNMKAMEDDKWHACIPDADVIVIVIWCQVAGEGIGKS